MIEIKKTFDKHLANITINNKLASEILNYAHSFVIKNTEHINFFGSGLIGVHRLRWTTIDRNRWIDDILQVDEIALKDDLDNVSAINPEYKVTSDLVNLSIVYLLHLVLTSSGLSANTKKETFFALVKILHYKFVSSLQSEYFRYPANEETAKATFDSLNQKFDLKRLGSWAALFQDRAENLYSKTSIHHHTLRTFRNDDDVLYILSDTQTKIRAVYKTVTKVFYQVRDSGHKVLITSSVMLVDSELIFRDVSREASKYQRYIDTVITDKADFIRAELVDALLNEFKSANPKLVYAGLNYLVTNYRDDRKKYLRQLVEGNLIYVFDFLKSKRIRTNDLALVTEKVRAMLNGSRVNDQKIIELRRLGDKVIIDASGGQLKATPAAERTVLLLYILLRTLTMKHYSGVMKTLSLAA